MSQSQQNHEPDRDRAPQLLAAFWVPFPIIVAFVGARMIVRYKMKSTGVDDWLMVAALVCVLPKLKYLWYQLTSQGHVSCVAGFLFHLCSQRRRKTHLLYQTGGT